MYIVGETGGPYSNQDYGLELEGSTDFIWAFNLGCVQMYHTFMYLSWAQLACRVVAPLDLVE